MNCPPDYVCITYPAWYVVAIMGFVVVMIVAAIVASAIFTRR
jgi:hypothetical protein